MVAKKYQTKMPAYTDYKGHSNREPAELQPSLTTTGPRLWRERRPRSWTNTSKITNSASFRPANCAWIHSQYDAGILSRSGDRRCR